MDAIALYGSGQTLHLEPHRNDGVEMVYLERGEVRWRIEGGVETVRAGDVFFTLPWHLHGSLDEYEPGHRYHWAILRLDKPCRQPRKRFGFHPDLDLSPATTAWLRTTLVEARRHALPATPALARILPALVRELQNEFPGRDASVVSFARLALVELGRSIEADAGDAPHRTAAEDRVRRFVSGLARDLAEDWTLETMADACDLGRSQFAALVKRTAGEPPMSLLNRLRVDRARQLLRETDRSVTEIAFDCGFHSSQYFARQFKRFTRTDARTYRQRSRNEDG